MWAEYYVVLRQLAGVPTCPPVWWLHLHVHEEELALLAISWGWHTCRRWSENVSQTVSDGRLKRAGKAGQQLRTYNVISVRMHQGHRLGSITLAMYTIVRTFSLPLL